MNSYHTMSLEEADIFTTMGSVYAEVARYDSAISAGHQETAHQAIARANELINYSKSSNRINSAQKKEMDKFSLLLNHIAKQGKKTNLDNYLMPFAVGARMRQFP